MQKQINFFSRSLIILLLAACNSGSNTTEEMEQAQMSSATYTVYVTYSSDCPFCIRYTKTLQDIKNELPKDWDFKFLKVIGEEEWDFDWRGSLSDNVIDDVDAIYIDRFGMDVYPQAVIADSVGNILYKGAIDDRAHQTGLSKFKVTKKYLQSAITSISKGESPRWKHTEAVGCYIEDHE
jgi:thiol-disulfide isomerase/thioredoxin